MIRFLVITLLSSAALADSNEVIITSMSYHPMISEKAASRLDNTIARGLNYTPMYGYVKTYNDFLFYSSYKAFVGLNCISQPMAGGVISAGADVNNVQIGLVGGAFYEDQKKFAQRGINTYFGDVIPIMGFEVNYRVYMDERSFIKITNTITHLLTNHALSVGMDL